MATKTPRKWQKEIKAWADGATIEHRFRRADGTTASWGVIKSPAFNVGEAHEYRVKPEPQVFNVYQHMMVPEERLAYLEDSENDLHAKRHPKRYTFVGTFTETPK